MSSSIGRNEFGDLLIDDLVFKSFDIIPNSYLDLSEMNKSNKIKVRIFDVKSDGSESDRYEIGITNLIKDESFLVVCGGWIPCAFIKRKTILYVDRNIVTEIVSRYKNGVKKNNGFFDSFDTIFLNNRDFSLDISAYVIEANKCEIPTNDLIDQQVASVKKALKLALPSLNVTKYPNGNYYYYDLKNMLSSGIKSRMDFLQEVAPRLNKQFTKKTRVETVNYIFETAERMEVLKNDFVIILALLRVGMVGNKTAAQMVLKDSQSYNEKNAYNTACDLSAIEVLINMHNYHVSKKSGYNVAFMTKDKPLALFSSLLSNVEISNANVGRLTISTTIIESIFGEDPFVLNAYKTWSKTDS